MTAVMKQDELPDFEGQEVAASQIRITNAGDGLTEALEVAPRALHHDEEVFILIRGTVEQVNHRNAKATKRKGAHLIRVHTVSASQATEIEPEYAQKILMVAADNLAQRKAEVAGQMQLQADEDLEGREAMATIDEGGLAPEFKGQ